MKKESKGLSSRYCKLSAIETRYKEFRKRRGSEHPEVYIFEKRLESNLKKISEDLRTGSFQFQSLRAVAIPKPNGKKRLICKLTTRDNVVQRLLAHFLMHDANGKLKDRLGLLKSTISYGVLRDRGTMLAVNEAVKLRNKYSWVVKTDISAFFDNIDRQQLVAKLRKELSGESLLPLIEQAVHLEIVESSAYIKNAINECKIKRGIGLRQGMPLSPILSSLYLRDFDQKLMANEYEIVRYADDIVGFCKSKEEAAELLAFIDSEVKKLKLSIPLVDSSINPSKTQIVNPEAEVIFLGIAIYKNEKGVYDKFVPKTRLPEVVKELDQFKDFNYLVKQGINVVDFNNKLKNILRGYENAYKGCKNRQCFISDLSNAIRKIRASVLETIFTQEIMSKLNDDKKRFFGLIE